ncbi:hypothetical protein Pdw03_3923 [Penicillium digitatum]|uniref:Uncharacterized protein n=1 Tax=Penicillium digitatum TaxID=36651 RepID=A0A7T6XH74_PENDI|nr:hypothetical protein Pdw03_3923 [Penicillium digitatum]
MSFAPLLRNPLLLNIPQLVFLSLTMVEPINITRRQRGTEKTNLRRGGSWRDLSILSLRHGREETAES